MISDFGPKKLPNTVEWYILTEIALIRWKQVIPLHFNSKLFLITDFWG